MRAFKNQSSDGNQSGSDSSRPKFEPIDYEEELNFSLQTPTVEKAEDAAANKADQVLATRPAEVEHHNLEVAEKDSPENTEETEHKVTVMIHRTDAEIKDEVQRPEKTSGDHVDAALPSAPETIADTKQPSESQGQKKPMASSHVTVIKLGPGKDDVSTKQSMTDEARKEAKPPMQKASSKGNFPLLPPPPQSTKIRSGHSHILRPTPASPVQRYCKVTIA